MKTDYAISEHPPKTRVGISENLLSIIVPVFNEQDAIIPFLSRLESAINEVTPAIDYEVLFVNDGSSDATELAIKTLIEKNSHIRLLNLSRNFGKDSALSAGLEYSRGSAAIPMDVDLQDPPELIAEMVTKWRAGAKVVNARRIDRSKDTWAKRVSANSFYSIFNVLADQPIPANVGDYRLLDRKVVDVVCSLGERARFNKALFSWVGFETDEVTFERPARTTGETTMSYWKLWNFALDGIFSASTTPLRMWSYVGSMISVGSFIYAAFIFVRTVIFGVETPGYASTIILILLFGGLNLFAIGIIGEYVGRIYTEVRQRPLYIVHSFHGAEEDN